MAADVSGASELPEISRLPVGLHHSINDQRSSHWLNYTTHMSIVRCRDVTLTALYL